jgi:hypothetical protein
LGERVQAMDMLDLLRHLAPAALTLGAAAVFALMQWAGDRVH